MARISPIPTTRVSDQLAYQRSMSQLQSDQVDLLRLQQQISTGRRVMLPSDDAPAALRAVALQRLLEQKTQVQGNISTNASYLNATDSALANASNLLSEAKGTALSVTGTVATDLQRAAAAEEIDRSIQQLLDSANQQFRDRYLFAGSRTTQQPFEQVGSYVRFNGNEKQLQSYSDIDILFQTNALGSEVFGGLSLPKVQSTDLNPLATSNTKLSTLNGGRGVQPGSILISDGTEHQVIDLSGAHTLQDVADIIERNPPFGRQLTVDVTATGLTVSIDSAGGGNLRITEVGGGTTASELGILAPNTTGLGPIVGTDLDPQLQLTTQLRDLLGTRAVARLDPGGSNNALLIEAKTAGAAFNGVTINYANDATSGTESVSYDSGTATFTVHIAEGSTTAAQARDLLNANPNFNANYTAGLDTIRDLANNGTGFVLTSASATTALGSGVQFDQNAGLQILNGNQTHVIDFSGAVTVEDMLNILNKSDADVLASMNADGRSISIRSRLSGADFAIGENGGNTAAQLGVRTSTTSTKLADLNHGLGVHSNETGDDFIIRRKDGTEMRFDVGSAVTIGDVIDQINNHPANADPARRVVARLATNGNGIELIDNGLAGNGQLTVQRVANSQAATDLGLIPAGQDTISSSGVSTVAGTTVSPIGLNNNLTITATHSGPLRNGVQVIFNDVSLGTDSATAVFDVVGGTLTIDYDSTLTTASTVLNAINTQSGGAFS
ncbi:MAG: flagellar hook-associated protein FlgL, partial [Planctomycetota bacterium]|nr:flagellar hook-associated protein FlgL [Planctomycetota bacterium]